MAITLDGSNGITTPGGATTDDITFADNDKAIFGAGSDLQIYHDGSNSYLNNTTGDLTLDASGILNLDSAFSSGTTGGIIRLNDAGTQFGDLYEDSGNFLIASAQVDKDIIFKGNDGGGIITAMTIDMSAGGNVGIGTTSPSYKLDVASHIQIRAGESLRLQNVAGSSAATISCDGAGTNSDLSFKTANTEHMSIDTSGRVTKPAQPAFMIGKNSESNIPINTTHVIGYNLERYDQGSNFASNTFTAPVTGKYYLRASVRVDNVDVSANYYSLAIVTSNREYAIINAPRYNSDPAYITFAVSATCDMDVGDTAYVQIIQSGGASQTDLDSSTNASYFCGYLLG